MEDELITIDTFETAFEANIAKNLLQDNDIEAVVVGEDLVSMLPPIPTVKVELKVFAADVEKAKQILADQKNQPLDEDTDQESQ